MPEVQGRTVGPGHGRPVGAVELPGAGPDLLELEVAWGVADHDEVGMRPPPQAAGGGVAVEGLPVRTGQPRAMVGQPPQPGERPVALPGNRLALPPVPHPPVADPGRCRDRLAYPLLDLRPQRLRVGVPAPQRGRQGRPDRGRGLVDRDLDPPAQLGSGGRPQGDPQLGVERVDDGGADPRPGLVQLGGAAVQLAAQSPVLAALAVVVPEAPPTLLPMNAPTVVVARRHCTTAPRRRPGARCRRAVAAAATATTSPTSGEAPTPPGPARGDRPPGSTGAGRRRPRRGRRA